MKVLLVSNFDDIPYEHYLLNLLFCEGLKYYHLRKNEYSEKKMRIYLEKLPPYFYDRIIIHSHFNLVKEYGLKGAHFTKKNIKKHHNDIKGEFKDFSHLSFSLHSIREIMKLEYNFNYIFLSPVFDSISNKGYNSKFKPEALKFFLKENKKRHQIIALSGIDQRSVVKARELGFDGAALLGHIWTNFESDSDIIAAINRFKGILKAAEIPQTKVNKSAVITEKATSS